MNLYHNFELKDDVPMLQDTGYRTETNTTAEAYKCGENVLSKWSIAKKCEQQGHSVREVYSTLYERNAERISTRAKYWSNTEFTKRFIHRIFLLHIILAYPQIFQHWLYLQDKQTMI